MSRVPTITLWSGEDCVIVEPGSSADKLFRDRGYVDPQDKIEIPIEEEIPATLFPVKKRGRPKKKIKDIGKINSGKTEKIT